MLPKIKSVLAGISPAHSSETSPVPGSSAPASEASIKGKLLLRGRTKARVESLTAELDAARRAFAQISHDSVADERLDITAVTDAMTQAEKKVLALEAALKIALQRDDVAYAALKQAEQQVAIEAEVAAVGELKSALLKVHQLKTDLERVFVDEVGPALKAARDILSKSGIRDGELYFLTEVPGTIKQHLLLAVCTVIGEGWVPQNMRKYERVSDCIPDEAFVRSRPRPGPSTPTTIPGWQGQVGG